MSLNIHEAVPYLQLQGAQSKERKCPIVRCIVRFVLIVVIMCVLYHRVVEALSLLKKKPNKLHKHRTGVNHRDNADI